MINSEQLVKQFAQDVKNVGGTAFYVGGTVRDQILQRPSKDADLEVYGVSQDSLEAILSKYQDVNEVGKSFAVYKLGQDIDISLPRKEVKTGLGHKGFQIEIDPFMEPSQAILRRDLSINALMKNVLTDEILDFCGGKQDIENKILKVVSENTFQEDSLRVLRLAQFASRFQFDIGQKTQALARETDLSDLPKERVWMEIEKLLMQSENPSVGLKWLQRLGIQDKLFPQLVLDKNVFRAVDTKDEFALIYNNINLLGKKFTQLNYEEALVVLLASMLHKTKIEKAIEVLDSLNIYTVNNYNVREEVIGLLNYNKTGFKNYKFYNEATNEEYYKLALKYKMKILGYFLRNIGLDKYSLSAFNVRVLKLNITSSSLSPLLQGKHLVELGFPQGKQIGDILSEVYELQMQEKITSLDMAKGYVIGKYLS